MTEFLDLGREIAPYLAPLLPFLRQAGDSAAGEGGKKAVQRASEKGASLWKQIEGPIGKNESALEALEAVASVPNDPSALESLAEVLRDDPELAKRLSEILLGRPLAPGVAIRAGGGSAISVGERSVSAANHSMAIGTFNQYNYASEEASAGQEEATLRRTYLNWLVGRVEHVPLTGIDPELKKPDKGPMSGSLESDPQLKLREIYTALRTRTRESESGLGKEGGDDPRRRLEELELLSALEVLEREPRLVLLGGPGSGKSSFVSFLTLCLAGEWMDYGGLNLEALNRAERVLEAELDSDSGDDTEPDARAELPARWHHRGLLPVRIVLRDFAAKGKLPEPGQPATAQAIAEFLRASLAAASLSAFAPILFRELRAGRCLILLDGLDEVPEAGEKRESLVKAVQDWADLHRDCRVLVTSRTYADQNQEWKLRDFAESELESFDRRQIAHFIALWYRRLAARRRCTTVEARLRSVQLRQEIFARPQLEALARQPLLLTLIACLHAWRKRELPRKRVELYRQAVGLLLDVWEEQKGSTSEGEALEPLSSLSEYLRVEPERLLHALEELAFTAHKTQGKESETADLDGDQLAGRLARLDESRSVHPQVLLADLRDRAGILVERSPNVFTFPHRTFQEYLAACYLSDGNFPDEIADLARAEPERWREVVLLVGANVASVSQGSLWHLVKALCWKEPGEPDTGAGDEWGALLAGQVAAESADPSRLGQRYEGGLKRLRNWLVHLMATESFPVRERALAGDLLAELGDPRFDPGTWFLPREKDRGFLEVPAGAFRMGSDRKADPGAYDDELEQHWVELPRYWLARYPVTVAQFRVFVEDSGREMGDSLWSQTPANRPVVNVAWQGALAYCEWLNAKLQQYAKRGELRSEDSPDLWDAIGVGDLRVTLPSEAEWEKAARGEDGRIYPWAGEASPNLANYGDTDLGRSTAVGCFRAGHGPYGHEDLSGNVWEWTRSLWMVGKGGKSDRSGYPYRVDDGRESLDASAGLRVLRGGPFYDNSSVVRCAYRYRVDPVYSYVSFGFRVVLSPFRSGL